VLHVLRFRRRRTTRRGRVRTPPRPRDTIIGQKLDQADTGQQNLGTFSATTNGEGRLLLDFIEMPSGRLVVLDIQAK